METKYLVARHHSGSRGHRGALSSRFLGLLPYTFIYLRRTSAVTRRVGGPIRGLRPQDAYTPTPVLAPSFGCAGAGSVGTNPGDGGPYYSV